MKKSFKKKTPWKYSATILRINKLGDQTPPPSLFPYLSTPQKSEILQFPRHVVVVAFKIFAAKTKPTKPFKINIFPQDAEQMLLHSKGKNSGTTHYRSCTQEAWNKSLFLTGILWRKKHAMVAPTTPPEPQCCQAAKGWQVEADGSTLWRVTYRRALASNP